MKFKKLKLYSTKLEAELQFYTETLGFELLSSNTNSFTVKIGWSALTFERSTTQYFYHYCFLIPSNQLQQALAWMEQRTTIVQIENDRKIQNFESWNADSFYFYDASGNIAEFIVRYDLDNSIADQFDSSKVLGINEMGMPTNDIRKTNELLEKELKTEFWKGDLARFGTNGTQEGLWLLPNYEVKDIWFPSTLKIAANPFKALIETRDKHFNICFKNEALEITPL